MPVIGWREWIGLPDLDVEPIKAKVDTGARSSSIHAFGIERHQRGAREYVCFRIHPLQRSSKRSVLVEAEVLEHRIVRSSNGQRSLRPVVLIEIELMGLRWPVELTLANRDEMGFRMLLGREAIRGRFLVDAGKSYYGGTPSKKQERRGLKAREV